MAKQAAAESEKKGMSERSNMIFCCFFSVLNFHNPEEKVRNDDLS